MNYQNIFSWFNCTKYSYKHYFYMKQKHLVKQKSAVELTK